MNTPHKFVALEELTISWDRHIVNKEQGNIRHIINGVKGLKQEVAGGPP